MTSPGDRGGSAAKPRPASMSSGRHSSEPVRCRMSWRPACSRRVSNVDGAILGTTVPDAVSASAARVLMPHGEEPLHLRSLDAGHPHDVILPLEPVLARLPEVAERAVMARVGTRRGPARHGRAEALAHAPEVGGHVGQADRDALAGAEDDVGQVGREPLCLREGLAVEGELERVLRSWMPRQLRVEHLVAPVAERGGPLDPLQEVRDPAPALREEDGLVDVVGARPHRLHGAPGPFLEVARGAQPSPRPRAGPWRAGPRERPARAPRPWSSGARRRRSRSSAAGLPGARGPGRAA